MSTKTKSKKDKPTYDTSITTKVKLTKPYRIIIDGNVVEGQVGDTIELPTVTYNRITEYYKL